MASKKNLSDLLREEVNKIPQSNPSDQQAAQVKPSLSEHQLASEEASMSTSTPDHAKGTTKTTTGTTRRSSTRKSSSRLTKIELESKVTSLTEGLKAAQEKESSLQEQIDHLESTLEQQNSSIQDLQDSLAQTQSLQTKLEQAKKDVLKLAQENERLQTQIKSLKQENLELKAQLKRPSRSLTAPPRSILERPIRPTQPPSQTGKASKTFDTWCYD